MATKVCQATPERASTTVFDTIASLPHGIQLDNLPTAPAGFTRRLYRSDAVEQGRWDWVTDLSPTATTYVDNGSSQTQGVTLSRAGFLHRPRPDASLVIDPGSS